MIDYVKMKVLEKSHLPFLYRVFEKGPVLAEKEVFIFSLLSGFPLYYATIIQEHKLRSYIRQKR